MKTDRFRKLLCWLVCIVMVFALLPAAALAEEDNVEYLYYEITDGKLSEPLTGTKLAGEYTPVAEADTAWADGWYVVSGEVTIGRRVTVSGDVHLILTDGCSLTVKGGIQVQDDDNDITNGSANSLTIYAQSTDESTMGKLTARNVVTYDAAIGGGYKGTGGTISINGGTVTAKGPMYCAGIGGGRFGAGGTTIINGGAVNATGGSEWGAGIGGGESGAGGNFTINGGTVTATGGTEAAGIGGGRIGADGGTISINGGTVTATGQSNGAGIGGGRGGAGGTIIITGGTVTATATGNYGAGIGGGWKCAGGTITITGGTINAIGGDNGAGIGGGSWGSDGGIITITGGAVNATGGSEWGAGIGGGWKGAGGTITITGGTVVAKGGLAAAGIGGGAAKDGGTITITSGTVTATGGKYGAGIGGGSYGDGGIITITGGIVTATGGQYGAGIGCGEDGESGTFTTNQEDKMGHAVIFASSTSGNHIADQSNKESGDWSGIIFEGDIGYVYKDQTVVDSFTMDSAKKLYVREGITLTVPNDKAITNNGNIYVKGVLDKESADQIAGNIPYYWLTVIGEDFTDYVRATAQPNLPCTIPENMTHTGWLGDNGVTYPPAFIMPYQVLTITPQFSAITYTVTWVDEDGTVLETDTVEYGKVPTYDGETPTKEGDAQYSYPFSGWTPKVSAVTGNVTYTAVYEKTLNTYTVTWADEDGTVLETDENVPYGTTPTYDGETPTKAADAQYTYTFSGWTPKVSEVTGNVTYTAVYEKAVNTYTVTWVDEDGTVLGTGTVEYGKVPTYDGTTPTKAPDDQYTYTFSGWTLKGSVDTGDMTYIAVWEATPVVVTPHTGDGIASVMLLAVLSGFGLIVVAPFARKQFR